MWRAVILALLLSCTAEREAPLSPAGDGIDGFGEDQNAEDDELDDDLDDDGDTDAAADGGDVCDPDTPDAVVAGRVFAPNLEIPISGALVYWANEDPEPIPDGAYCSECVGVPCGHDFVLTGPDGRFELPAESGPDRRLVVTKGQFMRSSAIDIKEGVNEVGPAKTSLPGRWKPSQGEWIPRIAVVKSEADRIFDVLEKIGVDEFELVGPGKGGSLLDDLDRMRKYHLIFVPCMAQEGMGQIGQQRIENIRTWVAEGGKLYVTDWANEYLFKPFPGYQTFHRPQQPDLDFYNTKGKVLDADLLAWLEAMPPSLADVGGGLPDLHELPHVGLRDNWSGLDALAAVDAMNEDGDAVDVGHYAWVEGPCKSCSSGAARPMTVSAEFGCGRMMFSTYHTNETAHEGLTPQELILLYIILEIGVCHDEPPPMAPPEG